MKTLRKSIEVVTVLTELAKQFSITLLLSKTTKNQVREFIHAKRCH